MAAVLRETRAEDVEHKKLRLNAALDQVRGSAAPLTATLDRAQLAAAFGSDEMDPTGGWVGGATHPSIAPIGWSGLVD